MPSLPKRAGGAPMRPVFWMTGSNDNDPVLAAASIGLARAGVPNAMQSLTEYAPEPPGVFYGLLGLGKTQPPGEWWNIDRGYFGAQRNGIGGYYRITRQALLVTYRAGVCCPATRWEKLGLEVAPWRVNPSGTVLVCPPPMRTAQWYGTMPEVWLTQTRKRLPAEVRGRVVVRQKGAPVPLAAALAGARCVIVFNSVVAVDALLAGVPAFAEHGPVRHWAGYGPNAADALPADFPYEREALFHYLAYNQATVEELKNGKAWRRAWEVQGNGLLQEERFRTATKP